MKETSQWGLFRRGDVFHHVIPTTRKLPVVTGRNGSAIACGDHRGQALEAHEGRRTSV
jgi:hypothetical protein